MAETEHPKMVFHDRDRLSAYRRAETVAIMLFGQLGSGNTHEGARELAGVRPLLNLTYSI